jgi:hypothetical protein
LDAPWPTGREAIVTVDGQALSVPALVGGEKVQPGYRCIGGHVTTFADAQQQVVGSNESNNKRSAASASGPSRDGFRSLSLG